MKNILLRIFKGLKSGRLLLKLYKQSGSLGTEKFETNSPYLENLNLKSLHIVKKRA